MLEDFVRQGAIRYICVSNWSAWHVTRALGVAERLNASPVCCYQGYYSLAARDLEREIVPMLASENIGLMVSAKLAALAAASTLAIEYLD